MDVLCAILLYLLICLIIHNLICVHNSIIGKHTRKMHNSDLLFAAKENSLKKYFERNGIKSVVIIII